MEETKDITPIMKEALRVLKLLMKDIKEGRCTEEELADALTKFHPKSNKEYFRKEDYCNEFKDMGYYIKDLDAFREKRKKFL